MHCIDDQEVSKEKSENFKVPSSENDIKSVQDIIEASD